MKKKKFSLLSGDTSKCILYPDFSIKWLAEQLTKIEEEESEAIAQACVNGLNYLALCELADVSDPVNNPNLMPTKYMILKGASDSALDGEGNLSDVSFTLHTDLPHTYSVASIGRALKLLGCIEEVEDGALFEGALFDAYCAYRATLATKPEKSAFSDTEITHATRDGDSCRSIAEYYNLYSWELLYSINEEAIGENPDVYL